jgi:hypothetical protein
VECICPQVTAFALAAIMKILAFSHQVKHLAVLYSFYSLALAYFILCRFVFNFFI